MSPKDRLGSDPLSWLKQESDPAAPQAPPDEPRLAEVLGADRWEPLAALEALSEPVCVWRPDGRVLYANPAFLALTGLSREEADFLELALDASSAAGTAWDLALPEQDAPQVCAADLSCRGEAQSSLWLKPRPLAGDEGPLVAVVCRLTQTGLPPGAQAAAVLEEALPGPAGQAPCLNRPALLELVSGFLPELGAPLVEARAARAMLAAATGGRDVGVYTPALERAALVFMLAAAQAMAAWVSEEVGPVPPAWQVRDADGGVLEFRLFGPPEVFREDDRGPDRGAAWDWLTGEALSRRGSLLFLRGRDLEIRLTIQP